MNKNIQIRETPDSVICILPKRANIVAVIFLALWTMGYLFILAISIYGQIVDHRITGALNFALVIFGLAALLAIQMILWNIKGCEIISLDAQSLEIRKTGLLFALPRKYETSLIGTFEVNMKSKRKMGAFYGFTGSTIQFTYWEQTKGFGQSLTEQQAKQIIQALNARLAISR